MKLAIGTALVIALLGIGACIYRTYKEKHKLALTVRRVLQMGFLIVLFNIISLFTESELVCSAAYSAYFAASDWLLYFMFRFSVEYIGNEFEKLVKKNLMILLLTLDSLALILNIFFEYLYVLNPVTMYDGELYFELTLKPWVSIHYAIVAMLVTFCLISLFYRSFHSPKFYRKKYLLVAVVMVVLVVLHIITFRAAIDWSVVGYILEAVCIYYCAIVYAPQRLLPQTLFEVAREMSVGLLVMDNEGKTMYNNAYAKQLTDGFEGVVNREGRSLESWCRKQYLDGEEDFIQEESFYKGDDEVILKVELHRMIDSRNQLQGGYFVLQDRTEEINEMKKKQYLATHDELTGLYNKEYFAEKVEQYIRRYPDEELLMICTDIKDFKMINDYFGTRIGDEILKNYAKMLKENLPGVYLCGRLENDIFSILASKEKFDVNVFEEQEKVAFSSLLQRKVSFPIINYMGIYEIEKKEKSVSVMCDRARVAISTVKGEFHKRVAYYDNKLRDKILYRQELIGELETALKEEQFVMYLQPQVDEEGKMLGAEALIRWIHPKKGFIPPGDFIPVFEENGLICDVDRFIWETACKQLRKWKDEGREELYISVNISPKDFYFLNVYEVFSELVEKYDINPKNLKIEITETAVVMDLNRQLDLIERLRQNGFVVEMDDFGSGYSSLNMLKDIHVDVLKIDMAFLKKAEDEERSKKILQMIIALSDQLDMPVITEGVESQEQVEFLKKMGCHIFQGYYFAKPMDVETFERTYLK